MPRQRHGELIRKTDPLGLTTGMSYDPAGNLAQKTWPDGTAVNYSYDADNQLTGIGYPDQGGVTYAYDADGNRTAMSDPSGTTSYRYDQSGRLTQVGENGENVGYSYDQAGNITGITYPDGLQVSYTYNGLNQPVSVSDGVYAAGVFYDNAGNRIGETLPNGVDVTYAYDPSGRLTVVESVYGARTIAESAYTLDNVGNRLSVTGAGGRTTRYSYDKDYELTGVRYPDGRREEYTYDPAGNRTSENGTPYVYDPDNQLISAGHEPYLYDENGNMVFGNNSLNLYDDENRLTDVLTLDGFKDIRYAYDGDGNRTSRSVSSLFDGDSTVQSAINRELAHLLIPQIGSGKGKGLPWPGPAGRVDDGLPGVLRGSGVPPGLLDGRGMDGRGSVSHEVYGPTEEYIYDFNAGLPRLLAEKDNGNLTNYLYDGRLYEGIIAASGSYGQGPDGAVDPGMYGRDGTGSVSGSVYGAGPGSRFPGFGPGNDGDPGGWWPNPGPVPGGRIFYQQDGLGSVEAITNINGRVLERYSYDAFGEPRVEGERIPNPFMFTGEPYDRADGLLYLRARYYDPQIGRFLTQDSFFGKLTDPLSENLYDYAQNNPILNVDPTGHGNKAGWLPDTGYNYSGGLNVTSVDFSTGWIDNIPQNLEDFIQKHSPALNWVESAIGRTLITNQPLSSQQRQESINRGFGALARGITSLGIEGGDGIDEEVPPSMSGLEGAGEAGNVPKNIYNSIKGAPQYPEGFESIQGGTVKYNVKNMALLEQLRQIEPGKWYKVMKDGFDTEGNQVSIHYFQSSTGKVFNVKVKPGWSNE